MPEFNRVLCAIALTEASRRALDCGLWWARRLEADVSVVHVHQLTPPVLDTERLTDIAAPPPAALSTPPITAEERSARLVDVENFVEGSRTDGLQVEVIVDEDMSLADAIVARADALAADLIVIGAGTGPATDHHALGRVTTGVLHAAPCSVLIVPPAAADVPDPCAGGVNRIMCAVSLSDESRQVLKYATTLADFSTAHLTVVHVVELFSEVASVAYDFDAHREARLQPACEEFVELTASVVGGQKPIEEIVAQGSACHEILKLAVEESSDLIVLGRGGTQKARGAGRPTGEAVARDARCPVLFVHAEPPAVALRPEPSVSEEAPLAASLLAGG